MIEQIGNYRVTDEIGSGGMAVVYKGIQESLKRTVAIKALKTSVSMDKDVVARFEREATSIASFQHENIITVYDFFSERGGLFIVMEYVEGIDLFDLLDRCNRLPGDVAAMIGLQIARALDYAHFRGVIHRDVKPANVILSNQGTVKLTDFGIARVEASDLTECGVGLGTPAYMSPEQILGAHLDHRSDLFSLGIVMYQLVTGKKPFVEDDSRSAMEKIRQDPPTRPRALAPGIPKALEAIILRCLEKRVEDRYGSAQELAIALQQYLAATVNQNYRARLVMFLKEQGVLSQDQTLATLHPALIGEALGKQPLFVLRGRMRRTLFVLLALLGLTLPAAGWLYHQQRAAVSVVRRTCPPPSGQPKPGFLRVLAHPWARVEIDGAVQLTTPTDRAFPLAPGKHRLRLLNPYFDTVEQDIVISEGESVTVTKMLGRRGKPGTEIAP